MKEIHLQILLISELFDVPRDTERILWLRRRRRGNTIEILETRRGDSTAARARNGVGGNVRVGPRSFCGTHGDREER